MGGVVVVVVVVAVPVPLGVGAEEPPPATVRVVVGVDPLLCGDGALATTAGAGDCGTLVAETSPEPPGCVPTFPADADPPAEPTVGPGGVVVGVLTGGPTGPVELAESTDWPMGPAPIVSPATDSAAAAAAPAATRRFRTK